MKSLKRWSPWAKVQRRRKTKLQGSKLCQNGTFNYTMHIQKYAEGRKLGESLWALVSLQTPLRAGRALPPCLSTSGLGGWHHVKAGGSSPEIFQKSMLWEAVCSWVYSAACVFLLLLPSSPFHLSFSSPPLLLFPPLPWGLSPVPEMSQECVSTGPCMVSAGDGMSHASGN